jgi:hypothetical protein
VVLRSDGLPPKFAFHSKNQQSVTGSLATSMEKSKIDHSNYAQVANFLGL